MEKYHRRKSRVEASKFRQPIAYVVIGLLIAAPVFYALGYSVAESNAADRINAVETKYELTKKALEVQISKNQELESRVAYLEATVRNLTKILDTVYDSIKDVHVSGEYDGIKIEAQALYIVSGRFCIDVTMDNTTEVQKTFTVQMVGEGVSGESKKTTLYANESRKVQICGNLRDIASNASIVIDGNAILQTVLVAG